MISTVKAALDDIAQEIRTERQAATNAKARLSTVSSNLAAMATKYADALTEINSYSTDGTDFETLSKDELAKLVTEYQALKDDADIAVTALADITEF